MLRRTSERRGGEENRKGRKCKRKVKYLKRPKEEKM